jgi:hypothetical protein
LVVLFIFILIIGVVVGSISNLIFPPSEAVYGEKVIEDIGGDGILVAGLDDCVKVSESYIPDGKFDTNRITNLSWSGAKNISYVDTQGKRGNMIVWKTSPDKYSVLDNNKTSYISDYVNGSVGGLCFMEYSPKNNQAYGIIITSGEIRYSEYDLLYNILDLNRTEFPATYQSYTPTYTSYGSGYSHYGGVDDSPYTIARNEPDWYYDYYDYGDFDEIDEYLVSDGYD